jgi:hypothetical protein
MLTIVAALTLTLALPDRASACSPPPLVWCTAPAVLPVAGSTIPANATGLVVLMGSGSLVLTGYPILSGSDGSTISIAPERFPALGDYVAYLRALSPLVEGVEYRLEGLSATNPCDPSSTLLETSFLAGPRAALPEHAGALRVSESHIVPGDSACDSVDSSVAQFGYVQDPALLPWRPLAVAQLLADGSAYGMLQALDPSYGATWNLSAACDDVPATVRTVSLSVVVPGVFSGETSALEHDLSCNTFEGCSVSDVRRSHHRGPTRGAVLLTLVVGGCALARRRRRRAGAVERQP